MKIKKEISFCFLIFLAIFAVATADDDYVNMEEVSNATVGSCAYLWGWYEPDSANYFVFSGL